jgi:NTP pyrophosphatase (non-canonical NTP hydrolase)
MLEFDQLQKDVQKTAVYPDHWGVLYPAIGLVDEACELLGKIREFYFPVEPHSNDPTYDLYCRLLAAQNFGIELGKYKKKLRGDNGYQFHESVVQLSTQRKAELENNQEQRDKLAAELGDVMWYASEVSRQIQISLQQVCERMTQKLADRAARNVIKGNGDNR